MKPQNFEVNATTVNLLPGNSEAATLAVRRKKLGLAAFTCALLFAAMAIGPVWAQNPPPGSNWDLAAHYSGPLTSYQSFSSTFVADSTTTYVSFAFREVPRYFAFDNASVTDLSHPGGEMLLNPGFENPGDIGLNIPTDWGRWIQPIDQTAIGVVTGANGGSCYPNGPFGGSQFWCDGSVEGYDGLYQILTTVPGDTYQITWELGDNSNQDISNPTIDMLTYATDGLPEGTEGYAPEPGSLALFGSGVLGIGGVLRKRFLG